MPIRGSPNGRRHTSPLHSLVGMARNGWSRSIGTTGRHQSEQVVAITRCAHPPLRQTRRRGSDGAWSRFPTVK